MTRILYDLTGRDDTRFSPYCWRAKMAMKHKGLDFDTKPVPFTDIPAIRDGSFKTVPVLEDDGVVVHDSFRIALHLEATYPDRPTLFGGPGGEATARFVEQWTNTAVNGGLVSLIVADVHRRLMPQDDSYFRESREKRFGKKLEEVSAGREARIDDIRKALAPARNTLQLQPFLGGDSPLFVDYILFGTLQWARVTSDFAFLEASDPVSAWFETCLDLYEGYGRGMKAAAAA